MLDWQLPFAKWFVEGTLNVSYNCLDRHVEAGRGDKVAYHWEGEPGDTRTITYAELLDEVSRFANVLKGLGVERGDRVGIYMPMIPELPIAMLACTRIGAAHSCIFGGFSPDSITDRVNDAEAKVIVTADGGYRRGAAAPAQAGGRRGRHRHPVGHRGRGGATAPTATSRWSPVATTGTTTSWPTRRPTARPSTWAARTCSTCSTRRAPRPSPRASCTPPAGYLTQVAFSHKYVFDLHPDTDVYWCAADIGWVTGHSYIVYGPLTNGATSVIYEGTPDTPGPRPPLVDRRALRRDPALHRAHRHPHVHEVGRHRAGGARPVEPAGARHRRRAHQPRGVDVVPRQHRRRPLPDRRHLVADRDRRPHGHAAARRHHHQAGLGHLRRCPASRSRSSTTTASRSRRAAATSPITKPWPSMLRGIWGDPDRYFDTYWSTYEGRYFAGDGAKLDDEGYLWLLGRVDDVMNVSGHRVSTTEVESALVDHPAVAEAAVVGANDPLTGQAIIGYVIVRGDVGEPTPELDRGDPPARRPPRSARRPGPRRSSWCPTCPRPAAARSCVACCATWPRAATSATPPRSPTPAVVEAIRDQAAAAPQED